MEKQDVPAAWMSHRTCRGQAETSHLWLDPEEELGWFCFVFNVCAWPSRQQPLFSKDMLEQITIHNYLGSQHDDSCHLVQPPAVQDNTRIEPGTISWLGSPWHSCVAHLLQR